MFPNALFPIYYFMFPISNPCFQMTMFLIYMEPKKPFLQPKNATKMIQGHLSTLRSIS